MQFSDQLTPVSPTENAIFGITNPGRLKTSCEDGFIGEKRSCILFLVSFMSFIVLIAKL